MTSPETSDKPTVTSATIPGNTAFHMCTPAPVGIGTPIKIDASELGTNRHLPMSEPI
jgi:hypothetical protein